ncbi:Sensor histidine kinase RcsC [Streptomyces violaceorubidus]
MIRNWSKAVRATVSAVGTSVWGPLVAAPGGAGDVHADHAVLSAVPDQPGGGPQPPPYGSGEELLAAQRAYFRRWGVIPAELFEDSPGLALTPATALFVHGSWVHLLGNMLFLYVFGAMTEERHGPPPVRLFYLGCGYLALLGYAGANAHSQESLVGASGAISAILGAFLFLALSAGRADQPPALPSSCRPALPGLGRRRRSGRPFSDGGAGRTGRRDLAHLVGFGLGFAFAWVRFGRTTRVDGVPVAAPEGEKPAVISAIVLIKTSVDRIPEIAEQIAALESVSEVFSVTGTYDLIAMVRVSRTRTRHHHEGHGAARAERRAAHHGRPAGQHRLPRRRSAHRAVRRRLRSRRRAAGRRGDLRAVPARHGPARDARLGPGSGCRSSGRSPRATAAGSTCAPPRAAGATFATHPGLKTEAGPKPAEEAPMNRILIVEDEERIASFVEKGLRANGFTTTAVADGDAAYEYALTGGFDLVVLDIGLPGRDGFTVLRELREARVTTPVIGVTARDWYGTNGCGSAWRAAPTTG